MSNTDQTTKSPEYISNNTASQSTKLIKDQSQGNVTKQELEVTCILSLGTCLEMFDRFLYIHMAVLLNTLFFPDASSSHFSLSVLALGSTFFFGPIGGLIFGYLGDKVGRTFVVFTTTFLTAIMCLSMVLLPTYQTIGITATYILTFCRIIQGISASSEFYSAHIYITENVKGTKNQCVLGIVLCIGSWVGGKFLAAGTVAVALFFFDNGISYAWRGVFLTGTFVACIGIYARSTLKESKEFTIAKKSIDALADKKSIYNSPANLKVSKISLTYYLILTMGNILFGLFPFTYCVDLLRTKLQCSASKIALQSLYVGIAYTFIMAAYIPLVRRFCALKIIKYRSYLCLVFLLFIPFLVGNIKTSLDVFILQILSLLCSITAFPASPMIYRVFPVLHRSKLVLITNSLGGAISFLFLNLSIPLISKYCGNYTFLIIGFPIALISLFSIDYFDKKYNKIFA